MEMNQELEIHRVFSDLLGELTDDEFWNWVRKWYEVDIILDSVDNWGVETKREAIDELKEIIIKRK